MGRDNDQCMFDASHLHAGTFDTSKLSYGVEVSACKVIVQVNCWDQGNPQVAMPAQLMDIRVSWIGTVW